jgi:cell division protein FtsL
MIVATVLLFAFLLLTCIHLQKTATVLSYNVHEASLSLDKIYRENKSYELKALELRSPNRVEDIARNKLGMVTPDSVFLESLAK